MSVDYGTYRVTGKNYYGELNGLWIQDYVFVSDPVSNKETKYFIVNSGRVKNDKWISDENPYLALPTEIEGGYPDVWVKPKFSAGDLLRDSDGNAYLYESKDRVIKLTNGQSGSGHVASVETLATLEGGPSYRTLRRLKTDRYDPEGISVKLAK